MLWSLSAIGIAVASGWIATGQFSVAGLTFATGRLHDGIVALIFFSMLSHGIQWFGDIRSFQGWNIAGKKLVGLQYLDDKNAKTELEAFAQELERVFEVEIKKTEKGGSSEQSLIRARDALPSVAERLPIFVKGVRDFGSYAFFYVYVWHFAAPMLAGVVAIAKLRHA
jgi:hypothetical protein